MLIRQSVAKIEMVMVLISAHTRRSRCLIHIYPEQTTILDPVILALRVIMKVANLQSCPDTLTNPDMLVWPNARREMT
jgi:hypothetical protein